MRNEIDFNNESAAFRAGYTSYVHNPSVQRTDNPYIPGTLQASDWLRGFDEAEADQSE